MVRFSTKNVSSLHKTRMGPNTQRPGPLEETIQVYMLHSQGEGVVKRVRVLEESHK